MSNSATSYVPQYRDIVWAKMKPWRPWPGKIVKNPKGSTKKENSHYVLFFGTENYGWVRRECIWPFEEFKDKYAQKGKEKSFLAAVRTGEEKCEARKKGELSGSEDEELEDDTANSSTSSEIFPLQTTLSSPNPKSLLTPKSETRKRQRKFSEIKQKKDIGREILKKAKKNLKIKEKSPVKIRTPEHSPFKKGLLAKSVSPVTSIVPAVPLHSPVNIPVINTFKEIDTSDHGIQQLHNVGVIALGTIGSEITLRLLEAGHKVTVWNKTESKCDDFIQMGARKSESPGEVFGSCDITLVCAPTADVVKNIVFMENGLNAANHKGCNLVVLTLMNPESSLDIEDVIKSRGGGYLEAPVYRVDEGDNKNLTVLAAGDEGLFKRCESVFKSIAKRCFFLGPTGMASKAALIINTFMGTVVGGLAEAVCLAERTNVLLREFLHVLNCSPLDSPFIYEKAKAMVDKDFTTRMPLLRVMEGMRDTLNMASRNRHTMPVAATAAEMFVSASGMSCGERDISAVYMPARF